MALGNAGYGLIGLAVVAFLFSALAGIFAPSRLKLATTLFTTGSLSIFGAFAALTALVVTDRFEYKYVFSHSDRATGLAYKIAAVWSAQEGSFLLWATTAAIFGLLVGRCTGTYRRWFTVPYALFLGSLAGILLYESPFKLQLIDGKALVPPDGLGMVPSLLNYWITIHPPTIFMGFGALTALFCWSFAALATRDMDSWIKPVRPWTIATATILGIGLCMGGFWAYETLGWGGFWAWDSVENTSFVPWLVALTLVHGIFIQVARGKWQFANTFLAGFSLLSFIYGTFLTRSGFLKDMSVHSFAEMDRGALRILVGIMAVSAAAFFGLWGTRLWQARRAASTESPKQGPFQLETFYSWGVTLLLGLALAAGIGMSVPLFMALTGRSGKVVDEALYHRVIVWLFVPTMVVMGIAPFLTWRSAAFKSSLGRLANALGLSVAILGLIMLSMRFVPGAFRPDPGATIPFPRGLNVPLTPWVLFLAWLTVFVLSTSLWRAGEMWKRARPSIGGVVSHAGLALAVGGLILSRGFERKEQVIVQRDRPGFGLGYVIAYDGTSKDYLQRENRVRFKFQDGKTSFSASPVLYYTERPDGGDPQPTVRPDIFFHGLYDVYVAISPMVFEVGDPISLKENQNVDVEKTNVKYLGLRREGEVGARGTKFIAKLVVTQPDGQQMTAEPYFAIGENGPERPNVEIGDYFVAVDRIDAATKAVTLQFYFKEPLFPLEVFYKPFTLFVWLGAGIMTLGGLIAALHRARGAKSVRPVLDGAEAISEDAPEPIAQS